jgi:putative transposase
MVLAREKFEKPTRRVHELWQTDFTQFKVFHHWGWYYLSLILDGYSPHIIACKLSGSVGAEDVEETLKLALDKAGPETARGRHLPRLPSDNGPAYLSKDLARFLQRKQMDHVRGAPYHPRAPVVFGVTQGKIDRWRHSMKNVVRPENYYSPSDLEGAIVAFVEYCNHARYHEAMDNLTPADVYFGRAKEVKERREEIKRRTLEKCRRDHARQEWGYIPG